MARAGSACGWLRACDHDVSGWSWSIRTRPCQISRSAASSGFPSSVATPPTPLCSSAPAFVAPAHVIVVTGDDGVNTEVAEQVGALAATRKEHRRVLSCYVNVDDEELCNLLDRETTFRGRRAHRGVAPSANGARGIPAPAAAARVRYRFFNIFRLAPRAVLHDANYSQILRERDGAPPWLFVVGTGPIGINLAVVAAQRWDSENGPEDPHLKITLVGTDAQTRVAAMQERWSSFRKVCDLDSLAIDPWQIYTNPLARSDDHEPRRPSAVIICPMDDVDGLRVSVSFRRWLDDDVPILLCTTRRNDSGPLLDLASVEVGGDIQRLSILEEVCQYWVDLVLDPPAFENLARSVHHNYVRHRREQGQPGDPSTSAWDLLPEDLQQSNLRQARNFEAKLERIGYTIEPVSESDTAPFAFAPADIERLAEMEHCDWIVERRQAGWSYAPAKDVKQKQSPYLICWSCLSDDIREYDREAMRDFAPALFRNDYAIMALGAGTEGTPSPPAPHDEAGCPLCKGPMTPDHHQESLGSGRTKIGSDEHGGS